MWGMGRCDGNSFGTVANTSHCKSPADSREPHRVLCVYVTVWSRGFPEPPVVLHKQPTTSRPPLLSLKTIHLVVKIKNSGVLTAPLQLFISGSVDDTTDAAATSDKVNFKNLERVKANCEGDGQLLRSFKHGGNKKLILKNVFPSSVPVCSSWAYTMHKLIYAHHAHFTPPTPV